MPSFTEAGAASRRAGGKGFAGRDRGSAFWARAVAWWLLVGCGGTGCGPTAAPRDPFALHLAFTCDTHGRLVPCGCFTGQFGGLTRLKTALALHPLDHSLRLDVGDAIGGTEDFDLIEYDYLLRAYAGMGFEAMNLGQREAALSVAQLRALKQNSPVPLLGANLLDRQTGAPVVDAWRLVRRGAYRIAVIGVLDPRLPGESLGEGLQVEKMEPVLTRLLPEIRKQADLVVLLAFADESTLSRLAREFYELDVILGGKVSQPAQQLVKENRSLISFVTNESRALGLLRLRLGLGGAPAVLAHDIVLLHDRIAQDESVRALASEYRERVRHTRLRVDSPEVLRADRVPGVRAAAEYAGTPACLNCHPAAAKVWQASGHAKAFQALLPVQADADPKCVGCHVVGFGSPSGYRREFAGARLVDVGCESCHGPGSLHVRQRQGDASVEFKFRPLAAGDCLKCHYGEFSRPFEWDRFWPAVRHGKEPAPSKP